MLCNPFQCKYGLHISLSCPFRVNFVYLSCNKCMQDDVEYFIYRYSKDIYPFLKNLIEKRDK